MARLYTQAMKLGHWKAQLNLAQMYLEGRGVAVDAKEAIRLTEDLMRQGVPAAWHRMGSLYMMGAGPLKQDDTVAYAFWQRAADMGSMESQAFLGEKLDADHDSPPSYWGNEVIGIRMMECAFAQGSALAAYSLGLSLNQSARTPEASQRALKVMHEGVKRGYKECASYLGSSFRLGDPIVGNAKDPFRGERYFVIGERLRFDKRLQLPNLDRVLPLPPAALSQWDGNPDTLIDAAKAVRVTPKVQKLSGHVYPHDHRAYIPPGQTLQVPSHLAHLPELPGFTSILADVPGATGLARASVTGYWQPRVSPARATDSIATARLRRDLANRPPLGFNEGERMQLDVGNTNLPHEDLAHYLITWHFMGWVVDQRVPQDWRARVGTVRAIAEAMQMTCKGDQACPQTGIWQPQVVDEAHPLFTTLGTPTSLVSEGWKWQAFVQKGQRMPGLRAKGLPVEDEQVEWRLMLACSSGFDGPVAV